MIVADTSALVSLASIDRLELLLAEFDVHVTETVVDELDATSEYDDADGDAATAVVAARDRLTVHQVDDEITSSRIDPGEGTSAVLTTRTAAAFLITDDLRALPELQTLADAQVAISPIVLKALVTRGELPREEAVENVDQLAVKRDWLGAPIYRRARELFD